MRKFEPWSSTEPVQKYTGCSADPTQTVAALSTTAPIANCLHRLIPDDCTISIRIGFGLTLVDRQPLNGEKSLLRRGGLNIHPSISRLVNHADEWTALRSSRRDSSESCGA